MLSRCKPMLFKSWSTCRLSLSRISSQCSAEYLSVFQASHDHNAPASCQHGMLQLQCTGTRNDMCQLDLAKWSHPDLVARDFVSKGSSTGCLILGFWGSLQPTIRKSQLRIRGKQLSQLLQHGRNRALPYRCKVENRIFQRETIGFTWCCLANPKRY